MRAQDNTHICDFNHSRFACLLSFKTSCITLSLSLHPPTVSVYTLHIGARILFGFGFMFSVFVLCGSKSDKKGNTYLARDSPSRRPHVSSCLDCVVAFCLPPPHAAPLLRALGVCAFNSARMHISQRRVCVRGCGRAVVRVCFVLRRTQKRLRAYCELAVCSQLGYREETSSKRQPAASASSAFVGIAALRS